jgi:hypothetical protein
MKLLVQGLPDHVVGTRSRRSTRDDVALNGSPTSANAALSAVWAAALNNGGSAQQHRPGWRSSRRSRAIGNFNSTDCNAASLSISVSARSRSTGTT